MFSLVIALLSFSESFSTKYFFLNNDSCMIRPNLNELNNCPFIISLNRSTASYNILSSKIYAPKKNINVKAINMITNKDKAKAMAEHILCD